VTTWYDTSKGLVPQVPHPPLCLSDGNPVDTYQTHAHARRDRGACCDAAGRPGTGRRQEEAES
jgi:hypothetical protein